MEALIKNKSLLDEKIYTEIVKKTQNITRQIIISVFGVLLILYTLWTLTIFQNFLLQGICALLGVALLLMANFEYRLLSPKGYRQQVALANGAPLWFTTGLFEEGMQVTGPTGRGVYVSYEKVKKVYTIPQGILLCMDNKMGMFFSKDGYQAGNEEETVRYLKEKCPRLQVKTSGRAL